MNADSSSFESTHRSSPFTEVAQKPTLGTSTDDGDHTVDVTIITDDSAQERTMVESEDAHGNGNGVDTKNFSQPNWGRTLSTAEEHEGDVNADPEKMSDPLRMRDNALEPSAVAEEGGISFSAVENLYPTLEKKPSAIASKPLPLVKSGYTTHAKLFE
ncbi:hypothetical protein C0991_009897 [Blastosporella zonata]|nr:hypothetical protein C0991_009897 [Blastosporella zonata]